MTFILLAATLTLPALPPAGHADCEAATNVVLKASAERRELAFDLAVSATASNSVEVAFGRDADEDGDLSRHEADLVVGWRCGSWFVVDGATGVRTDAEGATGERELHWWSWASADDSRRSVSATVGGVELFPAASSEYTSDEREAVTLNFQFSRGFRGRTLFRVVVSNVRGSCSRLATYCNM